MFCYNFNLRPYHQALAEGRLDLARRGVVARRQQKSRAQGGVVQVELG